MCGQSTATLDVEAELKAAQIRVVDEHAVEGSASEVAKLRAVDFMVVAPYNDQVRLIREVFSSHKRVAKVEVGTVDKFQGCDAALVFFSMATFGLTLLARRR